MRRVPKSEKGEKTWRQIFQSAQELFLHKGYHKTSVLSISKGAEVSPATFYQYFGSKNEIFEMILETFQNEFFNLLKSIFESDLLIEYKIETLMNQLFDTFWNFRSEYKVFREAEFIDKMLCSSFHERIKQIMRENDFYSNDDEQLNAIFWFLFGPLFYIAGYWILWNGQEVPKKTRENLFDFYINGLCSLNSNGFDVSEDVYDTVEKLNLKEETIINRGEKSKKKLFDAAEYLFGKNGYFETTIHGVASEAGLSVGSFYLYFSSKYELLSKLVKKTSKELRYVMKVYLSRFDDRRNQEIAGLKGFLVYFSHHSTMYGVIRECEFIDKKITLDYYDSLKRPYMIALEKSMKAGEIVDYDVEILSKILMGIGHILGQSLLILPRGPVDDYKIYLKHLASFMMFGFKGLK
jgi:AcrR family transcriptional regulator